MTILITGTGRGIGLGLTTHALTSGHTVIAVSRKTEPLNSLKSDYSKN